MEPFSISCTTCQAKLKVRDPSVVGQILTCPKCGSMVLVSAPGATQSDEAPGVEETSTVSPLPAPPSLPPDSPSAETDGLPDAPVPLTTVLPTDDWVSAKSRAWRGWLQIILAAVVGVLLAVGLLGLVAAQFNDDPLVDEHTPVDTAVQPVITTPVLEQSATTEAPSQPAPPSWEDTDLSPSAPLVDRSTNSVDESTADTVATPARAEPDSTDSVAEEAGDTLAAPDWMEPEAAEPSPPALVSEVPADVEDTPDFRSAETSEETAADRMTGANSLSKMLRDVEALLHDRDDGRVADATPPAAVPVADEVDPDAVPVLMRPRPRSVDVPQRLADRIPEIEYEKTPLIDFLRFVSEFSTVPITVHPESLIWLGLSPDTPVAGHLQDASVAEILANALTPLGLGYERLNDQLVVRRPLDDFREVTFEVGDLAAGDELQLKELGNWITSLISPETWRVAGGTGTIEPRGSSLVVRNTDTVLFEVLFCCEQLRLARGLPTRSRYDVRYVDWNVLHELAGARLDHKITLTFLAPTRLTRILRHMEKVAGVRLLVDWQSLIGEGWTPETELTFTANEQPFGAALAQLLSPMELGFRVVDDAVFQLASRDRLAGRKVLRFYAADQWRRGGMDAEQAVGQLRAQLETSVGAASPVLLSIDSKSGALFVVADEAALEELNRWMSP